MSSLIDSLRSIVGTPNFVVDGVVDYSLMLEYCFACLILIVVITSVFRIIGKWVSR